MARSGLEEFCPAPAHQNGVRIVLPSFVNLDDRYTVPRVFHSGVVGGPDLSGFCGEELAKLESEEDWIGPQ